MNEVDWHAQIAQECGANHISMGEHGDSAVGQFAATLLKKSDYPGLRFHHHLAAGYPRDASEVVVALPELRGFELGQCPAGPLAIIDLQQLVGQLDFDINPARERFGHFPAALERARKDSLDTFSG